MSTAAAADQRHRSGDELRERVLGWGRQRLDLLLLVALLVAVDLLPRGGPPGVQALGVVNGARLGLQALGIILVLRSNRIINFAQVQLGALSGLLFYEIWRHNELPLAVHAVCGSCVSGLPDDNSALQSTPALLHQALAGAGHDTWMAANFWLAAVVGLAVAPALGYLVYVVVLRRFDRAPRLIATVATVGVAQVLAAIAGYLPGTLFREDGQQQPDNLSIPLPSAEVFIRPTYFHLGDILTVAVVIAMLAALVGFFLRSRLGIAMRGAAENPARAATLGISVTRVAGVSWLFAGALSGLGAVLQVFQGGGASFGGASGAFDVTTLVQILAAVVFARLVSLPLVVAASIALGVVQQVLFWNYGSEAPFDGLLVVLIGGALLLQRRRESRAETEAAASYLAAREARPIPRELHVPGVEAGLRWLGIAVAVAVLGYPFVMSPEQVSLGSFIIVDAIVGLSLLVLTGWAGQISLGQFAFAAVGGYVTALLSAKAGLFILLALLGGGLAGAAAAVLVGLPALRLRGLYLAVTTMAFALATSAVLLNPDYLGRFLPDALDRPTVIGFDLGDERVYYYFSLLFLILSAVMVAGLRRGRTARALIACRDNEQAGQSFGISLVRARLEAFAVSGFIAALAGGLLAFHEHGVAAISYSPAQSGNVFLMVIIGGLSSIAGPLLGAVYVGSWLLFSSQLVQFLSTGLGVLVVLLLFPGGLGGMMYKVRDAMLRRYAIRHRIEVPSLLADRRVDAAAGVAAIAQEKRTGGGAAFVPVRYRIAGQWAGFEEERA